MTNEVSTEVSTAAPAGAAGGALIGAGGLSDFLNSNLDAIASAAAADLDPKKVAELCVNIASSERYRETLSGCTNGSMLAAVQQCVGYGLTPTPSMQFGYFIPWKNKSGQKEVAFKLSYMGILEIARRNGVTARANCVFKDDVFEWESGFEDRIVHKPNLFKRRDETTMVGVYCVAEIRAADGSATRQVEVMSKADVDAVRAKSTGPSGAWKDFYTEMARKTVIRRASKNWPLNVELHEAIARDAEGEFDFRRNPARVRAESPAESLAPGVRETVEAEVIGEDQQTYTREDLFEYHLGKIRTAQNLAELKARGKAAGCFPATAAEKKAINEAYAKRRIELQ
ncbi:MAG: recombinase RecT [Thermoguttaceae bacterium]|nr:recombinase RecT [Thermoguttaceae bacterium]